MRYSLSEIASICGGRLVGRDMAVSEIMTDSRSCAFGSEPLFVAIKGANHDSHNFLQGMYVRGVRAFMCERETADTEAMTDAGFVVVENSIRALQLLASDYRRQFKGTVVGITGSNGKTVIKEWISQVAPSGVKLFRSPKSYNSQLGVALSILMADGDEDVALIEAGISRPDEMSRLEHIIAPDIVVLSSIGDAHQENFITTEDKLSEKLRLAQRAKCVIFHSDYDFVEEQVARLPRDVERIDAAEESVGEGLEIASKRNAQVVAALCRRLGYDVEGVVAAKPVVAMRTEVKEGINDSLIVDDTYNCDINSLALALDYLHSVAAGREMTLILSDILQSGMGGDELYSRAARLVERSGVSHLIGIGSKIALYAKKFTCRTTMYPSVEEFLRNMSREDIASRAILLKGNRVSRFERLSHALGKKSHTTTLEVNLDAMRENLNYFRRKLNPATKLVAMVKASSYGAGDAEVAQMLQHQGVDYLAVAFADEGALLRARGITMPIVVLNADSDSFEAMIADHLEPEIYSLHSLSEFVVAAERYGEMNYPIHLKLDTGMHRLGFVDEDIQPLLDELHRHNRTVKVVSIFSHLACADMPEKDDVTRRQIERFDAMSSRIVMSLGYSVLRHLANSAAIERFPEAQFDMCRLGLGLYGFGYEHNEELQPVSKLRTRIVQIKRHAAGERIGYAGAGLIERNSLIATIPVGYADGLDRGLGCGVWSMIVAGRPAPIVGRVCMDSCMIDITNIEGVKEGDEVLVFSDVEGNTAEDMARAIGTIPYEIMTSVAVRVKRIYIKE